MGDSTISVKTEFGEVKVHKMPLSDYAELLKAMDTIPQSFLKFIKTQDDSKLQEMENSEFITILPAFLAESWGDLIKIVAVPTDKDAEFMARLDLADAVDVVGAILELNDIPRIIEAIKKMQALKNKLAKPKPIKQT